MIIIHITVTSIMKHNKCDHRYKTATAPHAMAATTPIPKLQSALPAPFPAPVSVAAASEEVPVPVAVVLTVVFRSDMLTADEAV
jgi:hypothetical protein